MTHNIVVFSKLYLFLQRKVVHWEIGGENIVLGMVHFLRISHINIQKDGSCFRHCSLKGLLNFSL